MNSSLSFMLGNPRSNRFVQVNHRPQIGGVGVGVGVGVGRGRGRGVGGGRGVGAQDDDATKEEQLLAAVETTTTTTTMTMAPGWGSSTWLLLHTLSSKLHEEKVQGGNSNKMKELVEIIYLICTNLPCAECSNHARQYLNTISFLKQVPSKSDLQRVLFQFHNNVNQRKGYRQFTTDEFDDKYSACVTRRIMQSFFHHFGNTRKNFLPKLMADDMYRQGIIRNLKHWMIGNLDLFHE